MIQVYSEPPERSSKFLQSRGISDEGLSPKQPFERRGVGIGPQATAGQQAFERPTVRHVPESAWGPAPRASVRNRPQDAGKIQRLLQRNRGRPAPGPKGLRLPRPESGSNRPDAS